MTGRAQPGAVGRSSRPGAATRFRATRIGSRWRRRPLTRLVGTLAVAVAVLSGCLPAATRAPAPSATARPAGGPSRSATPASAARPGTVPTCGTSARPPKTFAHVVWIWFENKDYRHIVGNLAQAPYFNAVAAACGLATNYHNLTHPSLPNYLAATAGGRVGPTYDCAPARCPQPGPSLFGLLDRSGLSWRSYLQSMPGVCWRANAGRYATRHNPAAYFTPLRPACFRDDLPLGSPTTGPLATSARAGTLPTFTFVAPNLCDDTHDCGIATGDKWLATWLPILTASPAYRSGSMVVLITFDEGEGNTFGEDCAASRTDPSCHVALLAVGRAVPAGRRTNQRFTPYSLLRTTEELLGVHPLLGNARTALGMRVGLGLG